MTAVKPFEPLNLLHTPLKGMNLAEASAGTGKTYALSALFVRLIVENGLDVNEILVVTFTEAATGELKDRIRSKLRTAVQAFEGQTGTDAFLKELTEKVPDPVGARHRLQEALRAFDQAAIYTIHGFCRRVLHDNAFESGRLFDTELVAEQEDLKAQVAYDFWRRHFYKGSPLFVNYALQKGFGPQELVPLLSDSVLDPHLKIIPDMGRVDSASEEQAYLEAFQTVSRAWSLCRADVEALLLDSGALNRNRYRRKSVQEWTAAMDRFVGQGMEDPVLFQGFEKFTVAEIESATKKGHPFPNHPFFGHCQVLKEAYDGLVVALDRRLTGLKIELVGQGRADLARKKRQRNIQSFHDLLLGVCKALGKKGGAVLAATMRRKYRVALIDEFQDTDPLQYAIFRRVFGTPPRGEEPVLFFIGDPKQAIYGFRNADVFAYMAAAQTVHARYSLGENWRSEPDLIRAVNTIFQGADRPFIYEEIPFQPVDAAEIEREYLTIDGREEPPFQLWFLDARKREKDDKPLTRARARGEIVNATAAEISRLVAQGKEGRARIGKRPIQEGDIAVLVRTNAEALQVHEALSGLGITSVVYATDDLFASHEAEEMERILAAIAEPNHAGLMGAALTTDILGRRAEDLDEGLTDDDKWQGWVLRFSSYHAAWRTEGFMAMFRRLLMDENVMPRLMALENGERRNTNVRHLCEALHQASFERGFGMTGLLKWLQERRRPERPLSEEHQLRLESDENAVKLVTIHKSKGLEYPIVFCPFVWEGLLGDKKRPSVFFHDPSGAMKKILDLGSDQIAAHRIRSDKEALAEDLRLFYVALTRAVNRCYMVWGRIRGAGRSAPAYLFHGGGDLHRDADVVGDVENRFEDLSDEDVLEALKSVTRQAPGAFRLAEMPGADAVVYRSPMSPEVSLTPRRFRGRIDRSWGISSFSAIVSGRQGEAPAGENDGRWGDTGSPPLYSEIVSPEKTQEDIFDFPAGATAGSFIHSVFEELDFSANGSRISELVSDKLVAFGFDAQWCPVICNMVQKVLSTPLPGRTARFSLSAIEPGERLNELEFYFPLMGFSASNLERAVSREGGGDGEKGIFPDSRVVSPARGYMRGFVDMVFRHDGWYYIVDWKSNYLGPQVSDYHRDALRQVMVVERYTLQYLIYTVALHQYLAMRVPEYDYDRHFGGVFYLFVRGMDPACGEQFGVYGARPDDRVVRRLAKEMSGRTKYQVRRKP